MSYGRELLDEYEVLYAINEWNKLRKVWTMDNGVEIHVKDMSYTHLENCMNFIKGKDDEWYKIFEDELDLRNKIILNALDKSPNKFNNVSITRGD